MKNTYQKLYLGLTAVALMSSCAPEIDGVEPTAGPEAIFTKYIAIGNSLTAGYADNGLYLEGQQVAYPNLIAEQLKKVGGGDFTSPFFSEAQRDGSGYLRLKALVDGQPVMEPVTANLAIRGQNPAGKPLYTKHSGEINNYGVPGMRLDMAFFPGMGSVMGNPYFERLLPEGQNLTQTYFSETTTKNHTFFSFWLGNNDVLGYATNGGYENPGDPTTKLTDVATFSNRYGQFIDALTLKSEKGVVATIPNVTAVPFFSTVTTARIVAGVTASTNGAFKKIFISTESGAREATNEDLFGLTFPTDTIGKVSEGKPGYGLSPLNPLHDKFVLDKDEIIEVNARITAFNDIIKETAKAKGLALADAYTYLNRVKSPGIVYNGVNINAAFITGNAFSLDGIHLTPMGNALIANLFIDAINAKYKSRITKVDATAYRGVKFP